MHSLDLIFQVIASKQRLLVPETIFNTSLDAFLITEQIVTVFLNKTPWWLLFGAWGTSLYGADFSKFKVWDWWMSSSSLLMIHQVTICSYFDMDTKRRFYLANEYFARRWILHLLNALIWTLSLFCVEMLKLHIQLLLCSAALIREQSNIPKLFTSLRHCWGLTNVKCGNCHPSRKKNWFKCAHLN